MTFFEIEIILGEKMEKLYQYESDLIQEGKKIIGGVDEVGRGPLVGNVVAACVVLPLNYQLDGLTDSKKLSEKKRNQFYEILIKDALAIGIGEVSAHKIDEINIYEATKVAMKQAIDQVERKLKLDHVLIDAMPLSLDIPTTSIIKGDSKSLSIAAASVIAKVTRDREMYELDKIYPMYGFSNNKGYGTKKHLEAISKYGVCKYHRMSYAPVTKYKDKINELDKKISVSK